MIDEGRKSGKMHHEAKALVIKVQTQSKTTVKLCHVRRNLP
jgi:hypothetical protein